MVHCPFNDDEIKQMHPPAYEVRQTMKNFHSKSTVGSGEEGQDIPLLPRGDSVAFSHHITIPGLISLK